MVDGGDRGWEKEKHEETTQAAQANADESLKRWFTREPRPRAGERLVVSKSASAFGGRFKEALRQNPQSQDDRPDSGRTASLR